MNRTVFPYIIAGLVLIAQCVLAFSPFLPFVSELLVKWRGGSPIHDIVVTMIGIHASLLTIFLISGYSALTAGVDKQREQLRSALNGLIYTRLLRDDEFYEQFQLQCKYATSRVWISYLDTRPPSEIDVDRSRYYRKHKALIRANRSVRYRRIIRETPDNLRWANDLMCELEGLANVDIAVLPDNPSEKMPTALSVQIIDTDHVWFVAVGSHERSSQYRDIYVHDRATVQIIEKYHERLWDKSRVIMSSGQRCES